MLMLLYSFKVPLLPKVARRPAAGRRAGAAAGGSAAGRGGWGSSVARFFPISMLNKSIINTP